MSLTATQVWVGLLLATGAVLVVGLWQCLKRGNALIDEQWDRPHAAAGTSRAWAMSAFFPAVCLLLTSMTFSRPEAASVAPAFTLRPVTRVLKQPQSPPFEPLASSPCSPLPLRVVDRHVRLAAKTHGISPELLRAVIFRESSYRPCAVSASGAIGLMQLKPATATEFGVADPFQPGENILGGARYLRWLLARYNGDARLALGAYHAGPTIVDTHGDLSPIPKTREYVADIMNMISPRPAIEPAGD